MRIVVLMPVGSPWSRNVASQLARLGHEVHVVDFERYDAKRAYLTGLRAVEEGEIALFARDVSGMHRLKSAFDSAARYLTCAPALRRICERLDPDIVLSMYGGGLALMVWASGFRPYAVYAVGSDVLLASRWSRAVLSRTLRAAAIVLANGEYLAEHTRRASPAARVRSLLIGVDPDRFRPGPKAASPISIICTRGFAPVYNNTYLIEGLARLAPTNLDVRVTFTSAGNDLGATRALADRLLPPYWRGRVEFLGGVPSDALVELLRHAHLYVSLSRSDGTSISLLEALSCGAFPILSDIPQNREWIEPGADNGLLVPLDCPDALARALAIGIADAPRREKASEHNRNLVLQRADIRACARQLAAELAQAVADHGRKAP